MKRPNKPADIPDFAVQGLKALQEAVDEVHEESRRTGKPIPVWRDGKVVWIIPEKQTPPPPRRAVTRGKAKPGRGRRGNGKK